MKKYGFFADWNPNPKYNLCIPGEEKSKVTAFLNFLESEEQILVCTHATLRSAFDGLGVKKLDDTLVAIDEFHHVSAEDDNILGQVLKSIMANSSAHIVAMTGSYFRGDSNYQTLNDVSKATATRDLTELVEAYKIFNRSGEVGAGTNYVFDWLIIGSYELNNNCIKCQR